MKKISLLLIVICLIGSIAACSPDEGLLIGETMKPIYTETGGIQFASPYPSGAPTIFLHTPTPEPTPTPIPMATALISPEVEPLPTPAPSNPTMYTSYAYLVSYNPSTCIAAFDYFDLLQGENAVDWLVISEGYSHDEAEAIVAEWADSEFISRNLNPQLRMIDLSTVPVRLMYYPSGEMVPGDAEPLTIEEVNMVYEYDPDLLLNSFFFRVEVNSNGEVTEVWQVFWP